MTGRRDAELRALVRVLEDYGRLREAEGGSGMDLPDLALVAVTCSVEQVGEEEATARVRDGVTAGRGWARLRSGLARAGRYPDDLGAPMYADWTVAAQASCRLRVVSGGAVYRARLWTVAERPLGAAEALGDGELPALREVRILLAQGLGPEIRALVHHVYCGAEPHEDVHALRRRFDRFAGFEPEGPR